MLTAFCGSWSMWTQITCGPMHMWEEYGTAERLLATMEDEALKKKVMRISRAGQQWEI